MFRHKKKQEDEITNPFIGGAEESGSSINVDDGAPSEEQVNATIKEAEASTEAPNEELLPSSVEEDDLAVNPEPTPISDEEIDQLLADEPEEVAPVKPADQIAEPEPATDYKKDIASKKSEEESLPNISIDSLSTGNEFEDLLAWADRDTAAKVAKIQKTIDGLKQRIQNINDDLERDTNGLSEDAKSLFEKNTKKNLDLIKDQISREEDLQHRYEEQRNTFVAKLNESLKKYGEEPKVEQFKAASMN
ncbi:MAG: hypothetical protein LBK50_03450 [Candidatus Nomurabacteria bacterium]|jgi:hypothetical protein|nr:hypothetical protein [Candidatus Nomurabacteria bacterium]